jgi:hypothetical protein
MYMFCIFLRSKIVKQSAHKIFIKSTIGSLSTCTINALIARLIAGGAATNYDVLVGKKSIGKMLENEDFAALPGPTYPIAGNKHFQPLCVNFSRVLRAANRSQKCKKTQMT